MSNVKSANVAGSFYPDDKQKLLSLLQNFSQNNKKDYSLESRAIIVPHAGYIYSGQLASDGFQYLAKNTKTLFVIAPSHHISIDKLALPEYDEFNTPLGNLPIDKEVVNDLISKFDCQHNNIAFEKEHAIEVQLPFVQFYLGDVKIVPIISGFSANNTLQNIIDYYFDKDGYSFVISSDLSHFYTTKDAKKLDNLTAEMIELLDFENIHPQQACGLSGILPMLNFAKRKNFSFLRVMMRNSGDVTGDKERVVGYGTWVLYENTKSEFIAKCCKDKVLEICIKSISRGLNKKKLEISDLGNLPMVLNELGAAFVTLKLEGELRGCVGSIVAHKPLVEDLIENAYSAAFRDNRFYSVTEDEFENLEISVSLLSAPQKMSFKDEKDLLEQIQPYIDGIIIKDGNYQAVYLPSVWEQLPSKVNFLNSLKQKAGLSPLHFSKTFEAYRFKTVHLE